MGVRSDQRLELGGERRKRGRLDRDDQTSCGPNACGMVRGVDVGVNSSPFSLEQQALGANQLQRVAAGEHADRLTGDREPGRDPSADRADADDRDLR